VVSTGSVKHTLLAGAEAGRQLTDNFRNTGYFNGASTTISVPYDNPVIGTTATFRQSATDADNHLRTNLAATYVQDQIELSRFVQVIAGLRFDHFDLQYRNNRTGDHYGPHRQPGLAAGGTRVQTHRYPLDLRQLRGVFYPVPEMNFLPLTTITQQVKPEKFNNSKRASSGTSIVIFRCDGALSFGIRTNTRATDPNDPPGSYRPAASAQRFEIG